MMLELSIYASEIIPLSYPVLVLVVSKQHASIESTIFHSFKHLNTDAAISSPVPSVIGIPNKMK